jgi:hypothetical protein
VVLIALPFVIIMIVSEPARHSVLGFLDALTP